MRWKGETRAQWRDRLIEDGERLFAWLPVQMDNGQWVWLEHYWTFLEPLHSMRVRFTKAIRREDAKPKPPARPAPPGMRR